MENIANSEAIQSSTRPEPSELVSSDPNEIAGSTTLESGSSGPGLSSSARSLFTNDECLPSTGPVAPRSCSQCNGSTPTPRKRKMCDENHIQPGKAVVKTEPTSPEKYCGMTRWIPDEQIDKKPRESEALKTPDVPIEKICRLKLKKVDSLTKRRFSKTPRKQ